MRASAMQIDHRTGLKTNLIGDGELTRPKAVVILAHGGKEDSFAAVDARQIAVVRMAPIARMLVTAGADSGLAVWRLLFRCRGWNGDGAYAIDDVRWAVQHVRRRHGDLPVIVVGHSMGGRAAVRAADEDGLVAVLALAPWLPFAEQHDQLAGRRLAVVHGLRDHVTSVAQSREFVSSVRSIAKEAAFIGLRRSGHSMVRRIRTWNRITTDYVLHTAFGVQPRGILADALHEGEVVV